MCSVIFQQGPELNLESDVRIPAWVHDRASFLRWAESDEFPREQLIKEMIHALMCMPEYQLA